MKDIAMQSDANNGQAERVSLPSSPDEWAPRNQDGPGWRSVPPTEGADRQWEWHEDAAETAGVTAEARRVERHVSKLATLMNATFHLDLMKLAAIKDTVVP